MVRPVDKGEGSVPQTHIANQAGSWSVPAPFHNRLAVIGVRSRLAIPQATSLPAAHTQEVRLDKRMKIVNVQGTFLSLYLNATVMVLARGPQWACALAHTLY